VKSEHFSQYEPDELRSCPTCEIIVGSEMHFKNPCRQGPWSSLLKRYDDMTFAVMCDGLGQDLNFDAGARWLLEMIIRN
jgi:hypothetical protein